MSEQGTERPANFHEEVSRLIGNPEIRGIAEHGINLFREKSLSLASLHELQNIIKARQRELSALYRPEDEAEYGLLQIERAGLEGFFRGIESGIESGKEMAIDAIRRMHA